MPAPQEIIDALESIIDIYFSSVRQRERAAFILCDNLNETACKTRARQHNLRFDINCEFYLALTADGVQLPASDLGGKINAYHELRKNMQFASPASTVDPNYCASAILDVIKVIDHCWPETSQKQFQPWLLCAIRVVRLYSATGDPAKRDFFERQMRNKRWRTTERESVRATARQIEFGLRDNWGLAIRMSAPLVEECLNEAEAP